MNKKILVIANASFSTTDSNGRTLSNYFVNVNIENLAQFCVYGNPNWNACENYYKVTDRQALQSFLKQRPFGGIEKEDQEGKEQPSSENTHVIKMVKTPLKVYLRELAWKYGKWHSKELDAWIEAFQPTHIFLSLADNCFLVDFARKVSKKYEIPIIAYSTEDYYFKDYNYMTQKKSVVYTILNKRLKKAFKKCEPYIIKGIFNTPMLADIYQKEFSFPCEYIFPKTDVDFIENTEVTEKVKVSYLGNLGINRHKALMEIGDALHSIDDQIKLDVYGPIPEQIKEEFLGNPNINYCGFVAFDEVVDIMHGSSLLVHAEYNDAFYNKDLRCAFSTKIADSICCGTPFFIYGSNELAGINFVEKQGCAFVVQDKNKLKETLEEALKNREKREEITKKAIEVREKYFVNQDNILDILD